MSQQINFYNPKLIKAKDWFSLTTVAVIYLVSACLMFLWYEELNMEASSKEQALQLAQKQFEDAQKQLNDTMMTAQSVVDVKAQKAELDALQQKYISKQKVIKAFEQTISGKRLHVADYMAGLTHQPIEKLWITGFKLDPFKNYMSLKGRAYKTELVPSYIEALSRESIFKGQLFGGLQIKEIEQANERKVEEVEPIASQQTAPPANAPASASMLAQTGAATANASNKPADAKASSEQLKAVKPTKVELKPMTLIEFEIKGMDVIPNMDTLSNDEEFKDSNAKPMPVDGAEKRVGGAAHG